MLPVVWRENAADELDGIIDYIAQIDEAAADRLEALALAAAERLAEFPYMCRPGRVPGTREAVVHSRHQYPPE